jgi:peroxiredoxin Q/BCP
MRKLLPVILLLVLAVPVVAQLQAPVADNGPKVGDMAPDFPIQAKPGQRGAQGTSLAQLSKEKNVLIMFFPAAFSPGCTNEFTQAGVHYDKFTALNVEMVGVSRDLIWAQYKFGEEVGAKNLFASDVDFTVIPKYGATSNPTAKNTLRHYYLVDKTGKIVWKDTTGQLFDTEKLATAIAGVLKK